MAKNWEASRKIPKSMMVYGDFVIPKDLEAFMPPDEILATLKQGDVIYTFDGDAYDLWTHKYVET